jgi:hypothetical protein
MSAFGFGRPGLESGNVGAIFSGMGRETEAAMPVMDADREA